MTKYLGGSFSVAVGSKDYRDGWDRIFGKKETSAECENCRGTGVEESEKGDTAECPECAGEGLIEGP
jgi:DnaJ-class molecular chaperone